MPVKFFSSPRRAFLYSPLGSRGSATAERRVHEHLDELARLEQLAGHAPLRAERRDERHQHDEAGVDHQLGHLGHAPDVLDAVGLGEAEIPVQTVPDVVAVEQVGVAPARDQPALEQVGDRRLARAGQPGEPDDAGALPLLPPRARACRTSRAWGWTLSARRSAVWIRPAATV